jgi:hypothetical protein
MADTPDIRRFLAGSGRFFWDGGFRPEALMIAGRGFGALVSRVDSTRRYHIVDVEPDPTGVAMYGDIRVGLATEYLGRACQLVAVWTTESGGRRLLLDEAGSEADLIRALDEAPDAPPPEPSSGDDAGRLDRDVSPAQRALAKAIQGDVLLGFRMADRLDEAGRLLAALSRAGFAVVPKREPPA